MKKNQKIIMFVVGAAIIALVVYAIYSTIRENAQPGELDGFAACLDEKGAVFYGAFWCPHCQDQKKAFGKSEKLIPYVECSTPNGQGQIATCQQANITSYPTWTFADGTRQVGTMSLQQLAEKTGCALPQNSQVTQ